MNVSELRGECISCLIYVPFAAITSKKKDIPLQFWIIFFGVVTVALVAALAGLIFMLCKMEECDHGTVS